MFQFRKIISCRETCFKLVPRDYPVEITKKKKYSDSTLIEGNFTTPLELHIPGVVPEAAQKAYFQLLIPNKWKNEEHKPICIHLAGTGDHVSKLGFYRLRIAVKAKPFKQNESICAFCICIFQFFWRRRNFIAKPLLKEANIGSIILENPFYGLRKPDDQM